MSQLSLLDIGDGKFIRLNHVIAYEHAPEKAYSAFSLGAEQPVKQTHPEAITIYLEGGHSLKTHDPEGIKRFLNRIIVSGSA